MLAASADVVAAPAPRDGEDLIVPLPKPFRLESGDVLPDDVIRLRRYGAADPTPIVVCGGISAGRFVAGENGWWRDLVGEGAAIDLARYGVLAFDFAPLGDARVRISPHDQARLALAALDNLGVTKLRAWIGASYGGIVGLSLAALAPDRLGRLCCISAAHRPAPLAQAWRGVQRRVLEFAATRGDAEEGLALARQLAMITYRSGEEFAERFPAGLDDDGRSALDRYLIARGDAYRETMAPQRWLSLSEAIDRGFVEPASIATPLTLIASESDQLATLEIMRELAQAAPRCETFCTMPSLYGHDAFLKETEQLTPLLRAFLDKTNV
jgi:homoserine O-acetyltransferase